MVNFVVKLLVFEKLVARVMQFTLMHYVVCHKGHVLVMALLCSTVMCIKSQGSLHFLSIVDYQLGKTVKKPS